MGNIVGNTFGIVASKDQKAAIADSIAEGNEAKFYITKNNSSNAGASCNAAGNQTDGIALTVNGNVLRGMSAAQEKAVNNFLNVNPAQVYKFKGTVATYADLTKITTVNAGDVYNVTDPTAQGYPKETNFAATKDGTGATSGIWDSLGGISMGVSTADQITIWEGQTTEDLPKQFKAISMRAYSDSAARGKYAADGITLTVGSGLYVGSMPYLSGNLPAIGLNLATSIEINNDSIRVSTSIVREGGILSLTGGDFPMHIDEQTLTDKVSTMLADYIPLSSLGDGSSGVYMSTDLDKTAMGPMLGVKLATNDYNIAFYDVVPGLLKIKSASLSSGDKSAGLYISSAKLTEFVNTLVNIAISSYLKAK